MGYSIRLEGDTKRLMNKLKKLQNIDTKGINSAIAEGLRTSTLERFKEGKDPADKRWQTSIRAASEGGKTLVQTAQLRNSIRSKADKSGAAVGTNVKYAATHQFGAKRTIRAKSSKGLRFNVGGHWVTKDKVKVNIPARPFLGISKEDEEEIKGILEDALGEK
nr:MAG TPA: virion morphogenesis protein [Caudoviricetes sp.]